MANRQMLEARIDNRLADLEERVFKDSVACQYIDEIKAMLFVYSQQFDEAEGATENEKSNATTKRAS